MDIRATVSSSQPSPSGRPPKPNRKGQSAPRSRILGMALGAGALAAVLVYFWLQSLSGPRKANRVTTTVPVLTVVRDIPARTIITEEMVQVRMVPSDQATAGAFQKTSDVVGKVASVSIANGLP